MWRQPVLAAEIWLDQLWQGVEKGFCQRGVVPWTACQPACLSSRQGGIEPSHPAGSATPHQWVSWLLASRVVCQDCE